MIRKTYCTPEESLRHIERVGFRPVCQYASMHAEYNEIGGIFTPSRNPRLEHGIWVYDANCVERIYLKDNK